MRIYRVYNFLFPFLKLLFCAISSIIDSIFISEATLLLYISVRHSVYNCNQDPMVFIFLIVENLLATL